MVHNLVNDRRGTEEEDLLSWNRCSNQDLVALPPSGKHYQNRQASDDHGPLGQLREFEVTQASLNQKSRAHDQAQLLEQGTPRDGVDGGIKIVEVQADLNRQHNHADLPQAALVEQIRLGRKGE